VNADDHVLDNPVRWSLASHHAHLSRRAGRVGTFPPDVATFCSLPLEPRTQDWADLAGLLGPGALADLFSSPATPPPGWEPVFRLEGVQMVAPTAGPIGTTSDGDRSHVVGGEGVVRLGAGDVPDMLELAGRTRPGPFWPRTHELGTYLGIRERGTLVAMAGERLRPPGWAEISAVCTGPEVRGRGHATTLIRALMAHITQRGDRPFLHVALDNTAAIALYERLGLTVRARVAFSGFRTPG
jgi:ribosomal protein S18 acetylase RimI-like enzyme